MLQVYGFFSFAELKQGRAFSVLIFSINNSPVVVNEKERSTIILYSVLILPCSSSPAAVVEHRNRPPFLPVRRSAHAQKPAEACRPGLAAAGGGAVPPPGVPAHVFCRVVDLTLHVRGRRLAAPTSSMCVCGLPCERSLIGLLRLLQADASTDEVYAQLALVAENEVRTSHSAPGRSIWFSARW